MRHPRLLCTLFALLAAWSPAAAQHPVAAPHPLDGRIVVFVANGAGGGSAFSDNLRFLVGQEQYPLVIRDVPWCRMGNVWQDHKDNEAQLSAAARMADQVAQLRRYCPGVRVVFAGYSTGSRVVLAAAEMLPPRSIDRILLLGSSVSCRYDLRPALRATVGGIDNFFNPEDPVLANAEDYLCTADGQKGPMAGRVGFGWPCDPRDCAAYANFRQVRWHPEMRGQGGHGVWAHPVVLRQVVAPVMLAPPCAVATVASAARNK